MDIKLKFPKDVCLKCGQCAQACDMGVIVRGEDGYPTVNKEQEEYCLKCQHCMAVCPLGGLSVFGLNPKNLESVRNAVNGDDLLNLIKSRRSIRTYRDENVDPIIMQKLVSSLSWAPTGCNHHQQKFVVISDKDDMQKFSKLAISKLRKVLKYLPIPKRYNHFKQAIIDGNDIIFIGAPHMLVVLTPKDAPCKDIDPTIAVSYFELLAQSFGIGTLWCGFAEICINMFPSLQKLLNIPKGYKPTRVMLFGPTDRTFVRTTQPEMSEIVKIDSEKLNELVKD